MFSLCFLNKKKCVLKKHTHHFPKINIELLSYTHLGPGGEQPARSRAPSLPPQMGIFAASYDLIFMYKSEWSAPLISFNPGNGVFRPVAINAYLPTLYSVLIPTSLFHGNTPFQWSPHFSLWPFLCTTSFMRLRTCLSCFLLLSPPPITLAFLFKPFFF